MVRLFKFLLGCAILLPSLCFAAQVHINPVRIDMVPGQKNASFKMNNVSDTPAIFQLKVVEWTQVNGEDIYTDTKDIIINPPMVNIPPKDFQLVRLGLRTSLNPKSEHTYRIIAQEIEDKSDTSEGFTLKTLLRISMPIFINPKTKTDNLIIQASKNKEGNFELYVANKSNRHLQITNIDLYRPDSDKSVETMLSTKDRFVYLLPEQEKTWIIQWKPEKTDKEMKLKLHTDWGYIQRDVSLSSS